MDEQTKAEAELARNVEAWIEDFAIAYEALKRLPGRRKVIDGYVEMYPDLAHLVERIATIEGVAPLPSFASGSPPKSGSDTPRGSEAVRLILQENVNNWFKVSDLVEELRNRGWLPESDNPANAVRAALQRLTDASDSDVVKGTERWHNTTKVVWSYQPDRDPGELPEPAAEYPMDEEPF